MDKKTKIRLLIGIPSPHLPGGPPQHLPFLVDYFRQSSDFSVDTFYIGSKITGKRSALSKMINTIGDLFIYGKNIIVHRPDVVHLNSAYTFDGIRRDVLYLAVSRVFGVRTVVKLHGSFDELILTRNLFYKLLGRIFIRLVTRAGVLSGIEKQLFIDQYGFPDKIVVVKNIVMRPPEGAHHGGSASLNGAGFPSLDPAYVYGLFVSRIDPKKGLDDLLHAVPLIARAVPGFRLVIVGDGDYAARCKQIAAELQIEDRLIWKGHMQNGSIFPLYRQADIYIFPSRYPEGMPMSLVDGLKSGIPIVTSKVRFALNYLEENKNCLFFQSGNPADIAEKTVSLLSNGPLRQLMKESNPGIVENFTQAIVGKEFEDIYCSILHVRHETTPAKF